MARNVPQPPNRNARIRPGRPIFVQHGGARPATPAEMANTLRNFPQPLQQASTTVFVGGAANGVGSVPAPVELDFAGDVVGTADDTVVVGLMGSAFVGPLSEGQTYVYQGGVLAPAQIQFWTVDDLDSSLGSATFTLSDSPDPVTLLRVELDGVNCINGGAGEYDYALSGATGTWNNTPPAYSATTGVGFRTLRAIYAVLL